MKRRVRKVLAVFEFLACQLGLKAPFFCNSFNGQTVDEGAPRLGVSLQGSLAVQSHWVVFQVLF